jgi:peptidylprolyl isomerase
MRRRAITAACLAAAIFVAGCGSSKSKSTTTTPTSTSASSSTPAISQQLPASDTDLSTKPTIPTPGGTPPAALESRDVVKGKGKAAKAGDKLTVQYVGVAYSTGQQFDASWDRGQPFQFQLGAHMVIPGWDQGLVGMKVGGRRELIIPPALAYGPQGQPPAIGPNETLIFMIDLKKIG